METLTCLPTLHGYQSVCRIESILTAAVRRRMKQFCIALLMLAGLSAVAEVVLAQSSLENIEPPTGFTPTELAEIKATLVQNISTDSEAIICYELYLKFHSGAVNKQEDGLVLTSLEKVALAATDISFMQYWVLQCFDQLFSSAPPDSGTAPDDPGTGGGASSGGDPAYVSAYTDYCGDIIESREAETKVEKYINKFTLFHERSHQKAVDEYWDKIKIEGESAKTTWFKTCRKLVKGYRRLVKGFTDDQQKLLLDSLAVYIENSSAVSTGDSVVDSALGVLIDAINELEGNGKIWGYALVIFFRDKKTETEEFFRLRNDPVTITKEETREHTETRKKRKSVLTKSGGKPPKDPNPPSPDWKPHVDLKGYQAYVEAHKK